MDAARALADLVEISPHVEAAAVLAGDGILGGTAGIPAGRGDDLARAVRELLDRAAAFRSDGARLTQIHAELGDGEVFAVTGPQGQTVVAVASERTAPGLVFYDLKRCLAALGSEGGDGS